MVQLKSHEGTADVPRKLSRVVGRPLEDATERDQAVDFGQKMLGEDGDFPRAGDVGDGDLSGIVALERVQSTIQELLGHELIPPAHDDADFLTFQAEGCFENGFHPKLDYGTPARALLGPAKINLMADPILIAKGDAPYYLLPRMANRHGIITGATGTGKTVTLQSLAQSFSNAGVPVFMADVKGDLAGICQAGDPANQRIQDRLKLLGIEPAFASCPVVFWDVFGAQGHPLRATVSEMGPLLLSRILNLNDVQSGVLSVAFRVADDNGLLLLDLKDLRAMIQYIGANAKEFGLQYGNVSAASVGAIQRGLLTLEEQGGESFFGEPALDLMDLIQTDGSGKGQVNILAADKLLQSPKLYATFLLWMLSELFENLPEVGDMDKPKLVFFFDEAHLLFEDAPKELLDKVEQVVRIIRSKGVGVYFVTQNPIDIPDEILGQMGNRVQHALRAFTPRDQEAVSKMAKTFRPNPSLKIEDVVLELGVGEALVSFLDEKGQPGVTERAFIVPPMSRVGAITPEQRSALIASSDLAGHYSQVLDRESAYERLTAQARQAAEHAPPAAPPRPAPPSAVEQLATGFLKSMTRAMGSSLGRSIIRGTLGGILGGLLGGGSRRRR